MYQCTSCTAEIASYAKSYKHCSPVSVHCLPRLVYAQFILASAANLLFRNLLKALGWTCWQVDDTSSDSLRLWKPQLNFTLYGRFVVFIPLLKSGKPDTHNPSQVLAEVTITTICCHSCLVYHSECFLFSITVSWKCRAEELSCRICQRDHARS